MTIRLCRRVLSDLGNEVKFCNGTIREANALDWCPACRARLPLWPATPGVEHTADFRSVKEAGMEEQQHQAAMCPHGQLPNWCPTCYKKEN